ncbi:dicarboxylate/amino acid:cation symporter [Hathewaya histolytica]|uniref:Sodium:dicarboxylate symporter family protein n=1 Tax=Hathewaya histolytica TaxID=1498 RepID=A0A4U9QX03_HATHI|nr:dicarboxylate/amino acid:cation symporter [Hathewaya histolytica]VTQ83296.1 sodium:dicarboxylate symporter family protein [Hathewaya histolytica]
MKKKKISLTSKIFIALVLGILFGIVFNKFLPKDINAVTIKWILGPLGNMFLRAIKMVVVPLVLFSLIVGISGIGDIKKLGRIGGKTVVFYLLTTAFAVSLALVVANVLKPGIGMNNIAKTVSSVKTAEAPFIMDMFTNMIPTNPIESMVKGDMLQIIFFAIIFGVAITSIGDKAKPVIELCDQINTILLKVITIVMQFAPLGVFALISQVIMNQGTSVLFSLIKYILVVVIGLVIHTFIVYAGALKLLGKVSPITFFRKFWPVMLMGFSTSSSNATIPLNMETCNEKMGVSNKVSSFTIPLGATINMDGTAIMQGVAAIFIAQVFKVDLSFQQQLIIILTSTLSSIGTAGVPSAGIVMLTMVLQQVGLPMEGIALVLSADRIVDMFRTAANITGDAVCTVIVAGSEKELDLDIYNNIEA